jgi:hypothetical protein
MHARMKIYNDTILVVKTEGGHLEELDEDGRPLLNLYLSSVVT